MPHRKQVAALEELCLRAVGDLVCTLGRRLIKPIVYGHLAPHAGLRILESNITNISTMLQQNIPLYLYDRMCVQVLRTVQQFIEQTKKSYDHHQPLNLFVSEMNIVVSLTEVILSPHLRSIDFTIWPKMMRYVMYKSLGKMCGLEILNLGSCLGSWTNPDKCNLDGLAQMSNLHTLSLCFDCNDYVIQILGENCPKLRHLDVTSSRSVTDRCIPSLLKCQFLTELQLNRTSVTVYGYGQLLVGLPYLQDLGRCDEFGKVLKHLKEFYPTRIYNIKKFQSRDVTRHDLRLLAEMCPDIYHVSLFHDEEVKLTVLTMMDHLTELKLLSCKFYEHCVKQLLEIKGHNLISLHLEHVDEVDLNALMYVSQFCPRLKHLVLYNCDFLDNYRLFANPDKLKVKPFQHLERLFVVADCASLHLEFLFTHCINIKFIHLGSSTGISHQLMVKILSRNPMSLLEELRILYSADLSLTTVDLLLASCPNLRILSELESWNVVQIELKNLSSKPHIERIRKSLSERLNKFTLIVSWHPPENKICPSSIAKYISDLGYGVYLAQPKHLNRKRQNVKVPIIPTETGNHDEDFGYDLLEWLGMVSLDANLKTGKHDDYVNSYECPEEHLVCDTLTYMEWRGFYPSHKIQQIYEYLIKYIQTFSTDINAHVPWISLYVQGFSDAPVSWNLTENHFFTNAENACGLFFKPDGNYLLCTQLTSNKRHK